VLRPAVEDDDLSGTGYHVVGTAYVHGVMDGEAARDVDDEVLAPIILI